MIALAAMTAATAFADKVYLKSGSILSGTGTVIAGDVVKITSDDLGAIEIPADKVSFVETDAEKQLAGIEGKLKNENFVSKAPEAVVNAEREKAEKLRALIDKLDASAAAMKK